MLSEGGVDPRILLLLVVVVVVFGLAFALLRLLFFGVTNVRTLMLLMSDLMLFRSIESYEFKLALR